MRRIGTIDNPTLAKRFSDYLTTQDISAALEPVDAQDEASAVDVWIKDERRIELAKSHYVRFLQAPADAEFDVSAEAAKRRTALEEENRRRLKNQKKVQHASTPGSSIPGVTDGARPTVTLIAIALCALAGLATNFGNPQPIRTADGRLAASAETRAYDAMRFVSAQDGRQSNDAFASIRKGEVWRLLSPAILHGSIGHFAMNMVGIFLLGSAIERIQGRFVITVLLVVTALAGTIVQAIWPESNNGGPNAIGASGAGFGLFGYVLLRPYYDNEFPIELPPIAAIFGIGFLVLGVAMVVQNVANGAHVGGLVSGMILASLFRLSRPTGPLQKSRRGKSS